MTDADPNAEALRSLLDGPLPASAISAVTGWSPRAAGPKLHALARQGLVRGRQELGENGKERTVWVLSRKGAEIVARGAVNSTPTPRPAAAAESSLLVTPGPSSQVAAADTTSAPARVDGEGLSHASKHETSVSVPDGPWPDLQRRQGGVNPELSLSTSLKAWLRVLLAAHSGAHSGSAAKRKVIDDDLSELEKQLGLVWKFGRYETPDGQTITPEKIEYLLQHQ